MFKPGQRFARYTILEELGHGGMGWVFKAIDPEHHTVALKILDLSLDCDHTFEQRFEREVEICSTLNHPHIVPFLEAGRSGGLQFMAVRFIDGETLEARLARDGPLPVDDVAKIGRCVCEALEYASGFHIIHRDIKPANVLLGAGGDVFVTDFGIARAEGAMAFTRPGSAMGTPEYMSPEEVSGEAVDHRHDVYSLGILMYEMIAGQTPFTGRNPLEILHKHVGEKPAPLRQHRPDVPRWLEAVVMKALVKDREQRYQTCGELAGAIGRGAADGGSDQSRPKGAGARSPHSGGVAALGSKLREMTRDPSRVLVAALITVLALLTVLLVLLGALLYRGAVKSSRPAPARLGALCREQGAAIACLPREARCTHRFHR